MNSLIQCSLFAIILSYKVISFKQAVDLSSSEKNLQTSFEQANLNQIEQSENTQLNQRILEKIDGCSNNCNNHGTCDDSNNTCICDTNWTGIECSQYVPRIAQQSTSSATTQTNCQECCSRVSCYRGQFGQNMCNCNSCPSLQTCCTNGYTCFNGSCNNNSCVCSDGYYRKDCSERCPNICKNGYCKGDKCLCSAGWSGADCTTRACPPQCYNDGTCNNGSCNCKEGWEGVDCSVVKCPNDCSGYGTCRYNKCNCKDSRYGNTCEYDIGKCKGQWVNQQCICKSGQFGPYCENSQNCYTNCPKKSEGGSDGQTGIIVGVICGVILAITLLVCCYCSCKAKTVIYTDDQVVQNHNHVQQSIIQVVQNAQDVQIIRSIQVIQQEHHILNKEPPILNFAQNENKYEMPDENMVEKQSPKPSEIKNCSICLDDIHVFEQYRTNCTFKHIFHKKCIDQWLLKHQTCPQCRSVITQ